MVSKGITRAKIVVTARAIADAEGLDGLSLRRIAEAMNTGQASLYRHVTSRNEILAAILDDFAAGIPLVVPGEKGPNAGTIVDQWTAIYRYFATAPWAARMVTDGIAMSDRSHRIYPHCAQVLRDVQVPEDDVFPTYRALWTLTLGYLTNRHPFDGVANAEASRDADFVYALDRLVAGILGSTST
ncbi:MAG: TetR/AcrR family transcriptional regulator [Thermomicrobiales bacterium]